VSEKDRVARILRDLKAATWDQLPPDPHRDEDLALFDAIVNNGLSPEDIRHLVRLSIAAWWPEGD
jgi:hypothetical protein